MSILPFLEDGVFGPQDVQAMSTALEDVCKALNLTDEANGARELLAKQIIALAQQGERSPTALRDRVMRDFV